MAKINNAILLTLKCKAFAKTAGVVAASLVALISLSSCAYSLGRGARSMPGGYNQISVPIFKNKSQETGVEVAFTQALQQEFLRSKVARVVDDPLAEVRIEGEIVSISYLPDAKKAAGDSSSGFLPKGTVIASQYRILTVVALTVVRRADNEKIWEGRFNGEGTYVAPQVTLTGVNTVNPLYNLSARRQNLEVMANNMMVEAHSRLTENF
jgi:hypothetical protein